MIALQLKKIQYIILGLRKHRDENIREREEIYPLVIEDNNACNDSSSFPLEVPGAKEMYSGKYSDLIDINIDPLIPQTSKIVEGLDIENNLINVKRDFHKIVEKIKKLMVYEFGSEVLVNQ